MDSSAEMRRRATECARMTGEDFTLNVKESHFRSVETLLD